MKSKLWYKVFNDYVDFTKAFNKNEPKTVADKDQTHASIS